MSSFSPGLDILDLNVQGLLKGSLKGLWGWPPEVAGMSREAKSTTKGTHQSNQM